MRIVFISDTHMKHDSVELPGGDVLIHAGDFTRRGSLHDLIEFNNWLGEQPFDLKIAIAGNHDFCFENQNEEAVKHLTNAVYLQDSSLHYQGLHFYGSPWQPMFFNWAFNLNAEQLEKKWKEIPGATDVLITHGPPYSILDKTSRGKLVGCKHLLDKVKIVKPKIHVFGHIHESYGVEMAQGITFINASTCGLDYCPTHAPIVLDL